MGLKKVPPVGTKVRFTGKFLKNTGQQRGASGLGRWTVTLCASGLRDVRPQGARLPVWEATGKPCDLCEGGAHVCTDEPHSAAKDPTGYEDVPVEVRKGMKVHWHMGNLEIIGASPKAEDYP